jgi:hypothetical protein
VPRDIGITPGTESCICAEVCVVTVLSRYSNAAQPQKQLLTPIAIAYTNFICLHFFPALNAHRRIHLRCMIAARF